MKSVRMANWRGIGFLLFCGLVLATTTGCNLQGKMDWVQPTTAAPRVGEVYCIRGWHGIWSKGIDEMARQLNEQGVTAHVFMPEQSSTLAATLVQRCKNSPQHEPICFIGHSWGVDASLQIARELDQAGVDVEVIACLDSVNETTVSKNVRLCYNYWMPGMFWRGNLLRGIALKQAPGSTGQLFNYNCDAECRSWRSDWTNHINFDDDPKIQKRIVEQVLAACPPRANWAPPVAAHPTAAPTSPALSSSR